MRGRHGLYTPSREKAGGGFVIYSPQNTYRMQTDVNRGMLNMSSDSKGMLEE